MDGTDIRSYAPELITAWEQANLPPALIAPVKDAWTRYLEIDAELGPVENDAESAATEVAEQVADGELTLAEGVVELAQRTAAMENITRGNSARKGRVLWESARGVCFRRIRAYLQQKGEELADFADEAGATRPREVLALLGVAEPVSVSAEDEVPA
jgi:hypothetical protein